MSVRANERQQKSGWHPGTFNDSIPMPDRTGYREIGKEFFTPQARCAMAGLCRYRVAGTDAVTAFLLGKSGLFREAISLKAVDTFLSQIGGKP